MAGASVQTPGDQLRSACAARSVAIESVLDGDDEVAGGVVVEPVSVLFGLEAGADGVVCMVPGVVV
jgi:hypothetical protein